MSEHYFYRIGEFTRAIRNSKGQVVRWDLHSWRPTNAVKEVWREEYALILQDERRIMKEKRALGIELNGHHFPFRAKSYKEVQKMGLIIINLA